MPFETAAGPAVLIANIADPQEIARRLGVSKQAVWNWGRRRELNGFPNPIAFGMYDYEEVYAWYKAWITQHPEKYPKAILALLKGEL